MRDGVSLQRHFSLAGRTPRISPVPLQQTCMKLVTLINSYMCKTCRLILNDVRWLSYHHSQSEGIDQHGMLRNLGCKQLHIKYWVLGPTWTDPDFLAAWIVHSESVSWHTWKMRTIILGLYSLSRQTSYHKISWSLEAARFTLKLF